MVGRTLLERVLGDGIDEGLRAADRGEPVAVGGALALHGERVAQEETVQADEAAGVAAVGMLGVEEPYEGGERPDGEDAGAREEPDESGGDSG